MIDSHLLVGGNADAAGRNEFHRIYESIQNRRGLPGAFL
jgi:hypothetical protein